MKTFLLVGILVFPVFVFAQSGQTKVVEDFIIASRQTDSVRVDVVKNQIVTLSIRRQRQWHSVLPVAGSAGLSQLPRDRNHAALHREVRRKGLPGLSFTIPVAAIQQLFRPKIKAYVEVKHYNLAGELMGIDYPVRSGKRLHLQTRVKQDGHLVISASNLSGTAAKGIIEITNAQPPKDTTIVTTDDPSTENEQPFAWENYLNGVTISAPVQQQSHDFIATYEANFGPSATWQALSTVGGGGGGYGGGGGDEYNPPSPEAKQKAKELRELEANKCEAAYVLSHLLDAPNMGQQLLWAKDYVEDYMVNIDMEKANQVGWSNENAFKHALISAVNYCLLGEHHAKNIGQLHETCDGINMNASPAESAMDLYNNDKGFQIAKTVGCNSNYAAIKSAIMNGYKQGVFHDINGNPIFAP